MSIFSIFKRKKEYVKPRCTAIIAAAGSASRMGEDKLFMLLGGMPVIAHTLIAFEGADAIDDIIIVTKSEKIVLMQDVCKEYGITKVTSIIAGGEERSDSVLAGVLAAKDTEYIAVHDGARPLVSAEAIASVFGAAVKSGAAIAAVPVKDTIKIVQRGIVVRTPSRDELYAAQTPQIFECNLIKGALSKAIKDKIRYPDDASAVEAIGMSVEISMGDYRNIKITTEEDILLAEALLAEREGL